MLDNEKLPRFLGWQSLTKNLEFKNIFIQNKRYIKKMNGATPSNTQPFDQELLHRTVDRIRRNLDLQEILQATVMEIRNLLGIDRVMVYRFDADGSGEVIAESCENLPSLLALHFPADNIPLQSREMFLRARQRSIVDVVNGKIGQSSLYPEGSLNDNIQFRSVDPCHLDYLKTMGVASSIVLPIIHKGIENDNLWGLLVSHHSQPRKLLKSEVWILQQLVDQISIAVAHNLLSSQLQQEQKREAVINEVITQLHALPTIQLQAALETTIAALKGCGGRLYIEATGELYTWGEQPKLPEPCQDDILEQHPLWMHWLSKFRKESAWATSNLYQETELKMMTTAFEKTKIRGLLVIPFDYHQNLLGVVSIFREEYNTEILWAGYRQTNPLQKLAQTSFQTWREQHQGQSLEWKHEDISLAQTLAYHFAATLQQQHTYKKLHDLNQNLEQKVQEQTAELEKSLLITNAVKLVSEQVRSTLDLKTTLQTIVCEVRKLLNADRVIIYQLSNNLDGEVVVEELGGDWKSALGLKASADCFPDEHTHKYFHRRVWTINDIATATLNSCHREFLQNLQVKANLIAPIQMGKNLWGLLIAHQCQAPRQWHPDEIELLEQLADQAVIAIQQAQLYEQSRQAETEAKIKAKQLGQALYDLQQAQTQLIQSEKMSGLGQLIAGIAHEINNPINFIYGNLSYAVAYTEQLQSLLEVYQNQYPQPNVTIDSASEEIDFDFLRIDLPKIMSSMKIGAERIRSIIVSLRNFARLDEAEMKPVNLHEGIDNTLLILQHRFNPNVGFPGIEVIKEYGDLPLVECYAGQINQVFMNIISNAIDALIESVQMCGDDISSPQIRIITEFIGNKKAIIRIGDNGLGIKDVDLKRIFDPFFTTKAIGQGNGLGLAISYQIIVDKHGGAIKCISQEGKGTEFIIEIPVR